MNAPVDLPSTKPKAGDRVRAQVGDGGTRNLHKTITLPDGSIVVTKEELEALGYGDAREGARQIRCMIRMEQRAKQPAEAPTEKPATVRVATPEDNDALIDLLMVDLQENAAMVATPDVPKIRRHVEMCTGQTAGCVAGVIDGPNGKPVAVVMLFALQWWWSSSYYYQEMPLFVHPDHRSSNHFRELVRFQMWWTDKLSANFGYRVYLLCGVLGTNKVRQKILAYRRWFRQVAAGFLYPTPFRGDET